MAEEKPILPPPSVPVRGFTTPVNQEGFFSERVDYTTPEYREIQRGTKYSTIVGADPNVVDQFAELYFLREVREIGAYPWATRFWATDTLAEDSYNSAVEYVSEAVTYPAYTRSYTIRRDSYEASTTLAIGSPLTSLIGAKVIDGGQDYTFATVKVIGTGSGAEVEAVIDADGTIASILVIKCGTGYTAAPDIEIIGDGGGAVAIGIIQPQSAVLVSQKKTEFPEEKLNTGGQAYAHPLKNEYVIVTRIYETLPGPWVYSQKEDTDGGLITVKTRRNISADITVEETLVGALWSDTTKKGVDDFVAEETVESRNIVIDDTTAGTATKMTTSRVDEDGKTVTVTRSQASAAYLASITPRETVSGGIWTRITSEPISHLKVWLITETRPIPGNILSTEKIDEDGLAIGVFKTMVTLAAFNAITPRETAASPGFWTRYTCEPISDLIVWQIQETRVLPGNVVSTEKIDEDGVAIGVFKTMDTLAVFNAITPRETATSPGFWTRNTCEPISDLVVWKVQESRALPGTAIESDKIDEDGKTIHEIRTLNKFSSITPLEEITGGGTWRKTEVKEVSDLVAWEVKTERPVPGNPIAETKFEEDGNEIDTVRTLKAASTITTQETLIAGVWKRTTKKAVTDLVAWEIVEARDVPGVQIPSAKVGEDGETELIYSTVKGASSIIPGQVESGGTLLTVEQKRISELISEEEVNIRDWLDSASYSVSIPENIIPLEFRALIPTKVESHIIAGTASMPVLGFQEFEHLQKQLTKRLYEERITKIGIVIPPAIQQIGEQTTEGYGGGTISIIRTLDSTGLSVDEGFSYVGSKVDPLGNGMDFKETRQFILTDDAYPIDTGSHVDEKYGIVIGISKQVVPEGTVGGIDGDGAYVEIKPHDIWRSISIASKLDETSLPDPVVTYGGQRHSFPPELQPGAIIDWASAFCGCSSSFSAILVANMKQYTGNVKTRITEQFYNGTPPDDVTITQFFPESHNFGYAWSSFCGDTDGNCRTKSGAPKFEIPLCLHGDLTLSIGIYTSWTFLATSPDILPHGDYIMLAPHVERWRFGVYRRVLTEVLVP